MKWSEIVRKTIARASVFPAQEDVASRAESAQEPFDLPDEENVNRVGKRRIEPKVSDVVATQMPLPAGYIYPDARQAAHIHAELLRELPDNHPLFGVPLETFAAREGNDDMLFRYRGNPQRFVLVHLTWLGRTEIDEHHPTIEFDGTFAEFLLWEEETYGLRPQR